MHIDSRKCPSCKAGFSPTTRRCPICGARLISSADAPATATRTERARTAVRGRGEPPATDSEYAEIVVLREAPVAWARELAAALDFHGIPYNLEPSPGGRAGDPSCRILVAHSDLPRAMAADDAVYAHQVPQTEREDEEPVELVGRRASLLRTAAFILAMLLFYVVRALFGD